MARWGLKVRSRGSLGDEGMFRVLAGKKDMIKGFVEQLSYFDVGRWRMKLCSIVPLGIEGLVKWFAGE